MGLYDELEKMQTEKKPRPTQPASPAPAKQDDKAAVDVQPKKPKTERAVERSNERTVERTKVRHSFDVFEDQLTTLEEIQHKAKKANGKKPSLGDLIQEALDKWIAEKLKG
jgi:sugar-specific transcriptional regulator TrmB